MWLLIIQQYLILLFRTSTFHTREIYVVRYKDASGLIFKEGGDLKIYPTFLFNMGFIKKRLLSKKMNLFNFYFAVKTVI